MSLFHNLGLARWAVAEASGARDPRARGPGGELVHRETVFAGLDAAPQALAAMIAGRTIGKTLVSIG